MSGLEPIAAVITAGNDLLDAGNTIVELLQKLKGQLVKQPDPAARALKTILEEIDKTFRVVHDALVRYLGILFHPKKPLDNEWNAKAREELLRLRHNALSPQIEETRTHSSKVGRIYDEYVDRWFETVFKPQEAAIIKGQFNKLWGVDSKIIADLGVLVKGLSNEAEGTLALVRRGDLSAANQRILNTETRLSPFIDELDSIMTKLRALEGDFNRIAGVSTI